MVQMPAILYSLAEEVDGRARATTRSPTALPSASSAASTREMVGGRSSKRSSFRSGSSPADGEQQELKKIDPLLALKFRAAVVPERLVNAVTTSSSRSSCRR